MNLEASQGLGSPGFPFLQQPPSSGVKELPPSPSGDVGPLPAFEQRLHRGVVRLLEFRQTLDDHSDDLEHEIRRIRSSFQQTIAHVAGVITRLGRFGSSQLTRYLQDLQFWAGLSCQKKEGFNDFEKMVSTLRYQHLTLKEEAEAEGKKCAEVLGKSIPLYQNILREAFPGLTFHEGIRVKEIITDLCVQLVTQGTRSKILVKRTCGAKHLFKCRYRRGVIQVVSREFLTKTATRIEEKVAVLCGPETAFGRLFFSVKPRKDNPSLNDQTCLASVGRELATVECLKKLGVKNIVLLKPVFKELPAAGTLKGLGVPWPTLGTAADRIRTTQIWPLPPEEFSLRVRIAHQVALALSGLHHNGFLHGNFLPKFVFLSPSEEGISACLGHFSQVIDKGRIMRSFVGSCLSISPEQWQGSETGWIATKGIDMWPFGLFLLSLLQGRNLIIEKMPETFPRLSPPEKFNILEERQLKQISVLSAKDPLQALIISLIDMDPKKRPSAEAAAGRLAALLIK